MTLAGALRLDTVGSPPVDSGHAVGRSRLRLVEPRAPRSSARRRETQVPIDADVGLVERLRDGDPAALEPLMERYASRVFRVAYGITRSEADAEEVVQDVFLTLFRKIGSFEGRSALGTWIYRVATNAALLKRRGKRAQVEVSLEDCLPTFGEDGHREGDRTLLMADWSDTPEQDFVSRETRAVVSRAIDALPPHYRAVLVLRDVEGLSNEEVAEAIDESVASVKSRLHRARMALRELLTRHFGPAGSGS
jgi:RNA polymerase sigma-70 factor (ECF subfamily)